MRIYYYLFCILACYNVNAISYLLAQDTPNDIKFATFIEGVRFAFIDLNEAEQKKVDETESIFLEHFKNYLKEIGFEKIAITSTEKQSLLNTVPSLCDIAHISIQTNMSKTYFTNHAITYRSCLKHEFKFASTDTLYNDPYLLDKIYTVWQNMYNKKRPYNKSSRLSLPKNMTEWNEATLKQYYKATHDVIEGIYEKMLAGTANKVSYRIGVVKNEEAGYDAIYMNGATNKEDWQQGELVATIKPTETQNFYQVIWKNADKTTTVKVYMAYDPKNMLHFTFADDRPPENYFKLYPKKVFEGNTMPVLATGSGIAISTDGYIVTNNHVVTGGSYFEVSATINGHLKKYSADLMVRDEMTDLAVLKITDWNFEGLNTIPYTFKSSIADIGEPVFTLGFPLSRTMGENIKLTDGTISSKTGYKNDVSTYQLTVPVHPGNSGGRLFDRDGNLIGIIKAKHSKAESATYAIKSRYVLNLIELLPERLILPTSNQVKGKDRTEQVKILQNTVFFIKVM